MSIGVLCLGILILALVVLFIAFFIIQHQRMLKEKKVQYLSCKKKQKFHHNRYQFYQKDIERLRSDYNKKLKDIIFLSKEISNKKKLILEVLEILREEVKQVDNQMDHDSDRIIHRRKNMIKNYWVELNGIKTAYLEKLKQVQSNQVSLERLKENKDDEFKIFAEIKSELEQLEDEYVRMLRNPVLPFRIERK